MQDPVIFANMFNKFLYHGKQVINPDNLTAMDTYSPVVQQGGHDIADRIKSKPDNIAIINTA